MLNYEYYPEVGDIVSHRELSGYYEIANVYIGFVLLKEINKWVDVSDIHYVQKSFESYKKPVETVDCSLDTNIPDTEESLTVRLVDVSIEPLIATLRYAESVDKKTKTDWSKTI